MKKLSLLGLFIGFTFVVNGQMISTKPPDEIKGYAVNMKHGAAVWTDSMVYYIDGLATWTGNSLGRWAVITGDINVKPLKGYFINGDSFEDGPPTGLPGIKPSNAPLPKDRRYIRNATWKILL